MSTNNTRENCRHCEVAESQGVTHIHPEGIEEFATQLSKSVRYSSGRGQYDAFPDCQDAYLDGVETAVAMMYIDLTGTPKSEGMLATFFHQELQKAREEERERIYKAVGSLDGEREKCNAGAGCPYPHDVLIKRSQVIEVINQSELDQPTV